MEESTVKQTRNADFKKIESYVEKYVKELQLHFDITDEDVRKILSNIYSKKSSRSWWSVLKSKL